MANSFTPEQIQEILDLYFENFAHRQYIGARYVPIFGRKDEESIEWDNSKPYEPLTIVLYQGNSYTSRQFVPTGVNINNQIYWAETGNYNAQIEQYRNEVLKINEDFNAFKDDINEDFNAFKDDINEDFNAFKDDINEDFNAFKDDINEDFNFTQGCFAVARDTSVNKNALFSYVNNEMHKIYTYDWVDDASAVFKINDYYYYVGNNEYKYTKNLKEWINGGNITTNNFVTAGRLWAFSLCEGRDGVYCLGSFQYEEENNAPTPFNYDSYYFRILYCRVSINEDGSLTFGEFEPLAFGNNQVVGYSYIDPYMIYSPEHGGYILAVKNEITSKIEIYYGDLSNLINANITHFGWGIEGPQIIKYKNGVIEVIAHAYSICGNEVTYHTNRRYPQCIVKFRLTNELNVLQTNSTQLLQVIPIDSIVRHPGVCLCDRDSFKQIMQIGIPNNTAYKWFSYKSNVPVYISVDANVPLENGERVEIPVINIPGLQFRYSNNSLLNIKLNWMRIFDFDEGVVTLVNTNGITTRGAIPGSAWAFLTNGDASKIIGYPGADNERPYYAQTLNCGSYTGIVDCHSIS